MSTGLGTPRSTISTLAIGNETASDSPTNSTLQADWLLCSDLQAIVLSSMHDLKMTLAANSRQPDNGTLLVFSLPQLYNYILVSFILS